MDTFLYLVTFLSLIYGLALARILSGYADLVQTRERVHWYGVHVFYGVAGLLYIALDWWILFGWREEATFTFYLFGFLLLKPSLLFFQVRLLMPDVEHGEPVDLEAHFFHIHRWYFGLGVAIALLDLPDTLLHEDGWTRLTQLGTPYFLIQAITIGLYVIAARTQNRRYHRILPWVLALLLGVAPLVTDLVR